MPFVSASSQFFEDDAGADNLTILQVLEPCKDSKVFKPPNPWVQSILALVAEIYAQDKLKLNLKFEIELLFRNMGIQARSIRPHTCPFLLSTLQIALSQARQSDW